MFSQTNVILETRLPVNNKISWNFKRWLISQLDTTLIPCYTTTIRNRVYIDIVMMQNLTKHVV